MNQQESLEKALIEPVSLVAHDTAWPVMFRAERTRLLTGFPDDFVDIRHIGSTAVPGLKAKPTIDLIAGMKDFGEVRELIARLLDAEYFFDAPGNAGFSERQWLFRHENGRRTHHLHLVQYDSQQWRDRVDFCELLKQDADLRRRYAELKWNLASSFGDRREQYAEAKLSFITTALSVRDADTD